MRLAIPSLSRVSPPLGSQAFSPDHSLQNCVNPVHKMIPTVLMSIFSSSAPHCLYRFLTRTQRRHCLGKSFRLTRRQISSLTIQLSAVGITHVCGDYLLPIYVCLQGNDAPIFIESWEYDRVAVILDYDCSWSYEDHSRKHGIALCPY